MLAGLSMGAGLAMTVAAARPDVRGVLLLHAGMPWEGGEWPAVPVQVHFAVADEWVDEGEPIKAVEQVARSGAPVSMHVHPGAARLFTDEDLPDEHDARSSELLTRPWCPWRRRARSLVPCATRRQRAAGEDRALVRRGELVVRVRRVVFESGRSAASARG